MRLNPSQWAVLAVAIAALAIGGGVAVATSERVRRFAEAIARAEGWYATGAGTPNRGQRANNPGNLMTPEWTLHQYATPEEGWAALYWQIELALTGRSRYYKPSMTIWQMAETYVGHAGWEDWARNVARFLNVSPHTPIGEAV